MFFFLNCYKIPSETMADDRWQSLVSQLTAPKDLKSKKYCEYLNYFQLLCTRKISFLQCFKLQNSFNKFNRGEKPRCFRSNIIYVLYICKLKFNTQLFPFKVWKAVFISPHDHYVSNGRTVHLLLKTELIPLVMFPIIWLKKKKKYQCNPSEV